MIEQQTLERSRQALLQFIEDCKRGESEPTASPWPPAIGRTAQKFVDSVSAGKLSEARKLAMAYWRQVTDADCTLPPSIGPLSTAIETLERQIGT